MNEPGPCINHTHFLKVSCQSDFNTTTLVASISDTDQSTNSSSLHYSLQTGMGNRLGLVFLRGHNSEQLIQSDRVDTIRCKHIGLGYYETPGSSLVSCYVGLTPFPFTPEHQQQKGHLQVRPTNDKWQIKSNQI